MVTIQRIITPTKVEPAASPYDLVELTINDQLIQGRPIEWDSEMVDSISQRNAAGLPVLATTVSTLCPSCGAGLQLGIRDGGVLITNFDCPYCRPVPERPDDPFLNPFRCGILSAATIDLDLIDMLGNQPETTVAERLAPPLFEDP